MGSHEHSTESQFLTTTTQCNTVEMQRAIHPPPQSIWLQNSHQQTGPKMKGKKMTSICRIEKSTLPDCVSDTMGGREIPPPLLLLTRYKASEY